MRDPKLKFSILLAQNSNKLSICLENNKKKKIASKRWETGSFRFVDNCLTIEQLPLLWWQRYLFLSFLVPGRDLARPTGREGRRTTKQPRGPETPGGPRRTRFDSLQNIFNFNDVGGGLGESQDNLIQKKYSFQVFKIIKRATKLKSCQGTYLMTIIQNL